MSFLTYRPFLPAYLAVGLAVVGVSYRLLVPGPGGGSSAQPTQSEQTDRDKLMDSLPSATVKRGRPIGISSWR